MGQSQTYQHANLQFTTQKFQKISLVIGYIFVTIRPIHNGKKNKHGNKNNAKTFVTKFPCKLVSWDYHVQQENDFVLYTTRCQSSRRACRNEVLLYPTGKLCLCRLNLRRASFVNCQDIWQVTLYHMFSEITSLYVPRLLLVVLCCTLHANHIPI